MSLTGILQVRRGEIVVVEKGQLWRIEKQQQSENETNIFLNNLICCYICKTKKWLN